MVKNNPALTYKTTPITSQEVFTSIKNEIDKHAKDRAIRNRYIATETFYNIGPYIDWHELLFSGADAWNKLSPEEKEQKNIESFLEE